MSGFLSLIFGATGSAIIPFNGLWWLVGMFILIFFLLLLAGFSVSVENILLFTLIFLLIIIQEGLFEIPIQVIIIPIIFIVLYIGNYVYYYFDKK